MKTKTLADFQICISAPLKIKRVCSFFDEYKKHSNDVVKRFVEKGYKKHHSKPNRKSRSKNLERSTLLDKTDSKRRNVIPFSVTFSRTLPNIRKKISIIHSEMKFKAIIGFRKNTSLRQIIGTNVMSHN